MEKEFLSTNEVAIRFGITRQAVLKQIKKGELTAKKIGRNYVFKKKDLPIMQGGELTTEKKRIIDEAVRRVVKDYGDTLKLLGQE